MTSRIHHLLDANCKSRPNNLALTDTLGNAWTYQDLSRKVDDLEYQMRQLGVQPNDRILMILENCALVIATIFAASKLGAVVVPFNARQTEGEVERVIAHCEPCLILFTSAVSKEAAQHAERMGAKPFAIGQRGIEFVSRGSQPDAILHDVSTILYTTGTTGVPKGVMLTHGNLLFGGKVACDVREMHDGDLLYGALPISHVFGLTSVVMASMQAGACIRLEPRFTAQKLYEALSSGVTLLSAVPQMHALLMQYTKEQGREKLPSSTLRYVSSGAAPLDPDWKRRAEAFLGIILQNGYGMTEATAGVCVTRHIDNNDDISVGTPFPGVKVKLDYQASGSEDNGPDDKVGEILVGGGGVMKGYFRNQEATEQAFTDDGWLRTGDLGRLDQHGNLHIAGRSKELIIHGGFNVYPPEVEAAFNDHPKVIQSAVIGHMVDGDEKVYAFVEASPKDWPEEEELRNFAAERLAGYKRPSRIVVTKKLPAATTGKILKHKLSSLL